jgi:hypothetical protein
MRFITVNAISNITKCDIQHLSSLDGLKRLYRFCVAKDRDSMEKTGFSGESRPPSHAAVAERSAAWQSGMVSAYAVRLQDWIQGSPTSETMAEWVEIVRVLTAPKDVKALQKDIGVQLDRLQNTPGLGRALAMLHATYGTDFAIVLVWKDEREPMKTREGLLLADCLQQFGSVDHAVWTVLGDMLGSPGDREDKKRVGRSSTYKESHEKKDLGV